MNWRKTHFADISEKNRASEFMDCTDGKVTKYTIVVCIWLFTYNTHSIPNCELLIVLGTQSEGNVSSSDTDKLSTNGANFPQLTRHYERNRGGAPRSQVLRRRW